MRSRLKWLVKDMLLHVGVVVHGFFTELYALGFLAKALVYTERPHGKVR